MFWRGLPPGVLEAVLQTVRAALACGVAYALATRLPEGGGELLVLRAQSSVRLDGELEFEALKRSRLAVREAHELIVCRG